MTKLNLKTNIPEIIALQFAQGKPVTSGLTGEPEVLYTLEDGRTWYVKPFVASQIDALSLGKGEPFQVTKCQVPGGRGFAYEVKHLTAKPQQPVAALRQVPQPAVSPAPARQGVETPSNGLVGQEVSQPTQQDTNAGMPISQRMMASFKVAVDAVAEAQAYANRRGLGLTFTSENLTSTALSVFINACKEDR